MISFIVAMDKNRVIGVDNQLPWHLPADLKRFKDITSHHPIIMGRKTFESIGKPLPNRKNIIITRQPNYKVEGCFIFNSLESALHFAEGLKEGEVFIIGGQELFQQALSIVSRIYLTLVHTAVTKGHAYFPEISYEDWQLIEKKDYQSDERNKFEYSFMTLERKVQ